MNQKLIKLDVENLDGAPVFDGTRIPVKNLFDYLKDGQTIEAFLKDFEDVKREQVIELLDMLEKLVT